VFCWKGIRDVETGATQSFVLVEAEGIRVFVRFSGFVRE
jgi:hypothetical protein